MKAFARFTVVDLNSEEADLEETFLAYYGTHCGNGRHGERQPGEGADHGA